MMGTWGLGSFSNDDALDWLADLTESGDAGMIHEILQQAANAESGEDLDSDVCCAALAAAEFVAAAQGRPPADFPEEAAAFLARHPLEPTDSLRALARRAIENVLAGSELLDLYKSSGTLDAWKQEVEGLLARLDETAR